jgi:hypothetical protein
VRVIPACDSARLLRLGRLVPLLLAVYELRYLLAHVASAGAALLGTGRADLHWGNPWVLVLLALGAGATLAEIGRGLRWQISRPSSSASLLGLWLLCSSALLVVMCGQELATGLADGHAIGPSVFTGAGLWSSLPAALIVGLLLTTAIGSARWIVSRVVARRIRRCARPSLRESVPRAAGVEIAPAPVPLLAGWSDRGPPLAAAAA